MFITILLGYRCVVYGIQVCSLFLFLCVSAVVFFRIKAFVCHYFTGIQVCRLFLFLCVSVVVFFRIKAFVHHYFTGIQVCSLFLFICGIF